MKKKVMTVFGTRPEAIKMAPLVKKLKENSDYFETLVVVTAQHREMLDQVLKLFNIVPDYDLNIMQAGQSLSQITTRVLDGLGQIIAKEKPDMVLVHGDTTTTFAGSLAAFYHQVAVGHVEAGLRTNNKYAPYPEEMNRRLTGVLTDLHFSPTESSKENLILEGISADNVFITGNTVIDALQATVKDTYNFSDDRLNNADLEHKKMILVTTHRRENIGEPLKQVYLSLRQVVREFDDAYVVFPVHKNPAVRSMVEEIIGGEEKIILVEPMDYEPFANLMQKAHIVLTDSGGIQEEAPSLGKPVLVLRDVTERPEAVAAGTVQLVGTSYENVYSKLQLLLNNESKYQSMSQSINPYGDGKASERIINVLKYYWKMTGDRPDEFKSLRDD